MSIHYTLEKMQLTHTLGTHTVPNHKTAITMLDCWNHVFICVFIPARRQICCTPSEPKRFTFVSSDHKMVSQKDKGFPVYFRANSKRAVLCLGFKRGFLRGRRPCMLALCTVRIVAAEMLTPHFSDNSQASSVALFLCFCETSLVT